MIQSRSSLWARAAAAERNEAALRDELAARELEVIELRKELAEQTRDGAEVSSGHIAAPYKDHETIARLRAEVNDFERERETVLAWRNGVEHLERALGVEHPSTRAGLWDAGRVDRLVEVARLMHEHYEAEQSAVQIQQVASEARARVAAAIANTKEAGE